MESGQVPLAELLSNFEKGTGLLQLCESRLKEAELRIDQLKKTASGASLSTFDSSESTS